MEILQNLVALVTAMPMDHLFIFVTLVALGLVGYVLHVHLSVVKALSTKSKE